MLFKFSVFLLVLISVFYATAVTTQDADTTITIPLNKTVTFDNKEIYGDFIRLNGSTTVQVNFTNIGPKLSFIVFQVHSQYHNVTLYQNFPSRSTEVTGTNIGFVSMLRKLPNDIPKTDTFYMQNLNPNVTVLVYISVHGYNSTDPIPGGCNMEFPVDITPYLMVTTNPAYITVDGAPASLDSNCAQVGIITVTFYMMYLPEQNFYSDDYFSGIRTMMTLKSILKEGSILPMTYWPTRRMLSAYHGIGVIFVAVASTSEGYSIYVPNHSYGCEKTDENGCVFSDDMLSQLFCAALLFVGLFISFFGHRFFKTEMFLAGFFSGYIISYILITIMDSSLASSALIAASAISGVFFGAIWLLFWWLYGLPVLAVLLPILNFGFLIGSILYFRSPAGVLYLHNDFNFWTIFLMVMFITAVAMVPVSYGANIICCAVLGAFTATYAFDYFMGSTLQYIFVNIVRRAVVPIFNKVILAPPFQWRDVLATLAWMVIAGLGWSFQVWHNQGRPPFPPPPRNTREAAPESFSSYGAIITPTVQPPTNATLYPGLIRSPQVVNSERTPLLVA